MAEETQEQKEQVETQPEEKNQEKEPVSSKQESKEEKAEEKAEENSTTDSRKAKKINRMTAEELNGKIGDLEKSGAINSKYYKHLLERKSELERELQ